MRKWERSKQVFKKGKYNNQVNWKCIQMFHKSAFPNVVQQMALETSIAIAAGLAVAAGVQRE